MMRMTQTREMTKVRRKAMKVSRARCRTGRGGAFCFRVNFFRSSAQFIDIRIRSCLALAISKLPEAMGI
jgi:hypothetical protein